MSHFIIRSLLLVGLCWTAMPEAIAGGTKLTESLTDKLKCSKVGGQARCDIETTGKYAVTAVISGDTFESRGITLSTLNNDTPITLTLGDYSFSSTFGSAASKTLTARKLSAKWTATHITCANSQCSKQKAVIHDTVTVTAGGSDYVTIKVSGTSNSGGTGNDFGKRIFADICGELGDGAYINGTERAIATLTVAGQSFSTAMTGLCKVKTQSTTRNGTRYDLTAINLKATADYLD